MTLIARFCSAERCGGQPVRLYENRAVEKPLPTEGESEAYDELMCDLRQTYRIPARPAIIGGASHQGRDGCLSRV